jgi:hypothetical protein
MQPLVPKHIKPGCGLQVQMYVTGMVLCYAGFLRFDDLCQVYVHHDVMRFYDHGMEICLWKSKNDPAAVGNWGLRELLAAGTYKRVPKQATSLNDNGTKKMQEVADGPLLCAVSSRGGDKGKLLQVTAPLAQPIQPVPYEEFLLAATKLLLQVGIDKPIRTA